MKTILVGLLLFVFASQFCHGQLKACFMSDGSSASEDFPCDPDAEVSACCSGGWRCVSSLYCIPSSGEFIISSCTDRLWQNNACSFPFPFHNGQVFNYSTNTTFCQDRTICPDKGNNTCCSAGAGKTEILFHYTDYMPSAQTDLSRYYSSYGYSISFSTTSSSSPIVLTSPTPTGSSAHEPSVSAAAASAARTAPSSSENQTQNPAPARLSNGAKAGIAVGNCVAIALLVGSVIIFLRRQRRKTMPADSLRLTPEGSPGPVTAGEPLEMHGESRPAELGRDGGRHEI